MQPSTRVVRCLRDLYALDMIVFISHVLRRQFVYEFTLLDFYILQNVYLSVRTT